MTRSRLYRAAFAATVMQVLVLAALAGSAQARTAWPLYPSGTAYPVAVHWNEPPAVAGGEDRTIVNEVIRLIQGTQNGDVVRMAIFSINDQPLIDEIKRAKDRGVVIAAVGPANNRSGALDTALGTNVRWCPGNGCITNDPEGTMHAKFIAFTATKDPSGVRRTNVTWISSSNFKGSSGHNDFNDAITTYGDTALHNKLAEIWQNMWSGSPYRGINYFDLGSGRGYVGAATGQLYASPEQDTDLVESVLTPISRRSADCSVRVQHNTISGRGAVTAQLRRLKSEGCRVQVLVANITAAMCTNLKNPGTGQITEMRQLPTVLHSKFIVFFDGGLNGGSSRVITGSHNLTFGALREHDEVLFRSADYRPYFDHYRDHFNVAWGRATPRVVNEDGAVCST